MQISTQTQVEMYNYLLNNKVAGNNIIDSNSQDFLSNSIKMLAKKLSGRAELFLRKPIMQMDNEILKMRSNYMCSSNHLIYYVLNEIDGCKRFLNQLGEVGDDKESELLNKKLATVFSQKPEDYEKISEDGGTVGRRKLIKLCKLYLAEKEFIIASKKKSDDKDFLARESTLAEKSLRKYSYELKNNIKVQGNKVLERLEHAMAMYTDIILCKEDRALIIDIKVYASFSENSHGKLMYNKGNNRYQVNSYIGAYLSKNKNISKISGLLIHIVNHDLYEKNKELQGADLTTEPDRPIRLYLIEDKGIDNIFADYRKIIEETLLN